MSWPRARRSVLRTSALGLLLAACTGAAGAPEPPPTALSSSFGAETAAPGSPEPDVVIASAPLPSEAAATQAAPAACTADVDCAEGSICEGTACAPSCPDGLPASVFFERDAPSPGPSEEPSLDAIAACMRAYRTRRLLLTGLMANEPICEGRGACRRLTPEYAMGLGSDEAGAEDNIGAIFEYGSDHYWIFLRVIFEVSVLDDDNRSCGVGDAGADGGAFALIDVVAKSLE